MHFSTAQEGTKKNKINYRMPLIMLQENAKRSPFFFLFFCYICTTALPICVSALTHPYRLVMQSEHGFKFCKLDVAAFKIPVHRLTIKICCLRHRKSEQYTRSNVLSSNRNRLLYKPLLTEQGPLVFL